MTDAAFTPENTSGRGPSATVPAEIDRWNWGAFLLHWIWGIGNRTWIALLMFVPFVNVIMMFLLGAKGSAWAWRNRRWDSVAQFRQVQRRWALWGVGVWVVCWLGFALMVGGLVHGFRQSDVFKMSVAQAEANAEVAALIGRPMSPGWPMGSLTVSGPRGSASLSYGLRGPQGEGTVHVEATRELGRWRIDEAVFAHDGTDRRIDLVSGGPARSDACRSGSADCV